MLKNHDIQKRTYRLTVNKYSVAMLSILYPTVTGIMSLTLRALHHVKNVDIMPLKNQ